MENRDKYFTRRRFIKTGGAVLAGSAWSTLHSQTPEGNKDEEGIDKIQQYRKLGRTGFEVSDISMGGTRNRETSIFRYAYDKGVNYFDTAEGYINGQSEKLLGDALKFMDRKKVFITTKLPIGQDETKTEILDRFAKCLGRLQTEYVDALFMHSVKEITLLNHTGFHEAVKELKSQGKLRYCGVSSHGPRNDNQDSMEKVLTAAAEDGRFDVLLLIYNFMNDQAGRNILKACKKNNLGTTAMKTSPGVLKAEPVDPENLTGEQQQLIKRYQKRGMSYEESLVRLQQRANELKEITQKTLPFAKKFNISGEEQLRLASIQWVLQNPDIHTACVSFSDFSQVDRTIPISGSEMSRLNHGFLDRFGSAANSFYCRHACRECISGCPQQVPVSTIMRYAYYFQNQQREKEAMEKYARLLGWHSPGCANCDAPCLEKCPYRLDIQTQLLQAHSMLTMNRTLT